MHCFSYTLRLRSVAVAVSAFIFFIMLAVPQPTAAADPFQACSDADTCGTGYTCRLNPWKGDDAPAGWPTTAIPFDGTSDRICCDLAWGCLPSGAVQDATGLGDEDPRVIISQIINVLLGFLGIIAVILILAGGFMWMTAAGNDDQIVRAKKTITAGVIGLVIVLAAFGLAQFAVNALVDATTA